MDGAAVSVLAANIPQAVSTIATSAAAIRAQHVIAERTKWRDKIRLALLNAIVEGTVAHRQTLWVILKLNTNPICPEDLALVELSKKHFENALAEDDLEELLDRAALLLKHDWERAKREAGHDTIARRMPYSEFLVSRSDDSAPRRFKSWSGQRPLD